MNKHNSKVKSNVEIIRSIRGDWGAISPVTKVTGVFKKEDERCGTDETAEEEGRGSAAPDSRVQDLS